MCDREEDLRTAATTSTSGRAAIKHAREILMICIDGLGVLLTKSVGDASKNKTGGNVNSSDEINEGRGNIHSLASKHSELGLRFRARVAGFAFHSHGSVTLE